MPPDREPSAASDESGIDGIDASALARVMQVVPLGAGLLAGGAVALIVVSWLLIYILVFIPRGTVG